MSTLLNQGYEDDFSYEGMAAALIEMSALHNIGILDINGCSSLTSVPPEIGQLIQFQNYRH